MRLEALYRARFSAAHSWSAELTGDSGTEGQNFLLTEGRCEGQIAASWRAANYPRRRTDGTLTPDFRGALETDDGATILFAWRGYLRTGPSGTRELVGSMTHITDDQRYRWLNDAFCAVAGEIRNQPQQNATDVVLDIYKLAWDPLAERFLSRALTDSEHPSEPGIAAPSLSAGDHPITSGFAAPDRA